MEEIRLGFISSSDYAKMNPWHSTPQLTPLACYTHSIPGMNRKHFISLSQKRELFTQMSLDDVTALTANNRQISE